MILCDFKNLLSENMIGVGEQSPANAGLCISGASGLRPLHPLGDLIERRADHQGPHLRDALGNPIRVIPTPGQAADVAQGAALIECFKTDAVMVAKGYDCDALVQRIGALRVTHRPDGSARNTARRCPWPSQGKNSALRGVLALTALRPPPLRPRPPAPATGARRRRPGRSRWPCP